MSREEIWKDIKGYEGLYQVSNFGEVCSSYKYKGIQKHLLHKGVNRCGYYIVSLRKDKKDKTYLVHRLVAKAFLPNDTNQPVVNHIDGNKLNNNINNLEWCSHSHNTKESFRLGLSKVNKTMLGKVGGKCPNSVPVNQYTLDGIFIKRWDSSVDAMHYFGLKYNHISKCCRGIRHSYAGYKWRYADDI